MVRGEVRRWSDAFAAAVENLDIRFERVESKLDQLLRQRAAEERDAAQSGVFDGLRRAD